MNIHGYELIGTLRTDNSGTARWGFARRQDGREVFIKEFLSPVYPVSMTEFSMMQIASGRQICQEFERKKQRLYKSLGECRSGGIVYVEDFFRHDSKYYMVTERVNDMSSIAPEHIASLDLAQRLTLCKVIAYNMRSIHQKGIVHSDIKPNNILIKRTAAGYFTAKIIDFDASFFEDDIPSPDDLQCDTVYLAPEAFLYICEELDRLTTKADVFALGVLFCQYLTGIMPLFDKEKYTYLYASILDGAGFAIKNNIPDSVKHILRDMLAENPDDRPDVVQIFDRFEQAERELRGEKKPEEKTEVSVKPVPEPVKAPVKKKGFNKAARSL